MHAYLCVFFRFLEKSILNTKAYKKYANAHEIYKNV